MKIKFIFLNSLAYTYTSAEDEEETFIFPPFSKNVPIRMQEEEKTKKLNKNK